jgi:arabinose-5-phosphate isomerase
LLKIDQIIKIGRKTLQIERDTLEELRESVDISFAKCVLTLFECRGRILVTGVGKSALVAKKIVATFNSTGTQSVYMHAADAVHGDLGMIAAEDIVICLSKSGETSEIKVLLPILKNFGNTIIGMTSNRQSYLATHADLLLYLPVTQEADPNHLAPTASTIAQMAMGDTLAMVLLEARGFSQKQFAKFHPGGSLGKQLYFKVDDIYPQNERPFVGPESSIREVILEMTSKRLGMTAVLDERGKVTGIITDGDLRRMLEKYNDTSSLVAKDIMTADPKTIFSGALAVDAFRMMQQNSITQVIVVDNNNYLGVVHLHDLNREGIV